MTNKHIGRPDEGGLERTESIRLRATKEEKAFLVAKAKNEGVSLNHLILSKFFNDLEKRYHKTLDKQK